METKMKNRKYNWSAIALITAMILAGSGSCTRDYEELELASYPTTPEVFIDGFSAGLNYAAFGGSKVTAFDVDKKEKYEGSASMKFEVPDFEDPEGAYAGGTYFTTVARDLSGYDALTFWAKASKSATIDLVGFGNDLGESKYQVSLQNLAVNSNWKKFVIPIPDPSRLTQEKGMFFYSEGPEDGKGYTFWIDEVKFEKLGTIAHRQPIIFDGIDKVESAVNGLKFPVGGLKVSFNMPTGIDQTVIASPAYFTFASSNPGVASVDATGLVSVLSEGTAVITATSGGADAEGSLTVQSAGNFTHAPAPTADQEDVISIFSNQYVNVPVDFYNGYWQPYQTTTSADFTVDGDAVLVYNNFNFVGIQFTSPTIDATSMTHLHMDIWIPNAVAPGDKLAVKLVDMGPDGALDGTDPTLVYEVPAPLASQSWISVDIALSGLSSRSKLAQIILERIGSSLTGFYLDNIYLHGNGGGTVAPTEAAPTPQARDAADVISIYSDAYANLAGTDYPDWGQATVVSDVQVAGNNTLKFTGLNYQGIQLASSQNVTSMGYLHLDFWTVSSAEFKVSLISTGPVEKAYSLIVPTTGWTSVDIPLTAFSPVNLADIIQLKFDGNGDIYLDNLYFYTSGGGTADMPSVAAPVPPARNAADVISLFSNAYTNKTVNSWSAGWDDSDVSDLQVSGDDVKKYTFTNFAGIDFSSNKFDASGMTHFHIDIWTPDEVMSKSLSIKNVDFGGGTAEVTSHILTVVHTPTGDIPALAKGSWVSIDVPITAFTGNLTRSDLAQMVLTCNLRTLYIDNIYFYKSGGGTATEPTAAAPTPTRDAASVISMFSGAYTNVTVDTWKTDWSAATYEEVSVAGNPTKKYSALNFVGIETGTAPINATAMTHLHLDVWSPDITNFGVKLVDFGANGVFGGGDDVEHQINYASPAKGVWVSYDIPLSDFTGLTTKAHLAQYILVGQPTGASTIFVDNLYFYSGGAAATEPTAAAPTPTRNAASVISMFSGAYTNVTVDTWKTDWSAATYEEVSVAGNPTKKYSALNFVGIETGTAPINATAMTHLHLDVWSPEITNFGVKLVDFGANGVFGGGDDVEHQINYASPAKGVWVSYDIPLSNFTGLTTKAHLAQYIFVGQPTGSTTIWVDNIYFYTDGGGTGTTGPTAAAPAPPARSASNVVSIYSDTYTPITINNFDAGWCGGAAVTQVLVAGNNTLKKNAGINCQGIDFSTNRQNLSTFTHIHFDLYTDDTDLTGDVFNVKLVDFAGGTGEASALEVNINTGTTPAIVAGTWVSVDINITALGGVVTGNLTRSDVAQIGITTANLTNVWYDNIYLYK